MKEITLATQTLFAELAQRSLDAEFDESYDERGRFKRRRIKGQLYWYYARDEGARRRETYVGPVRDTAIDDRVKRFGTIKNDFKQRREMVRALLATGLPALDPMSSLVIEALWKAGFFRLRGVLVGTTAFHCYAGYLGVRLESSTLMTQDVDFAQFYDISHFVGDSMPPILEVLRKADTSFQPLPEAFDRSSATRFRTEQGYLVEFLTPNRGSDDHMGRPAEMPALGGASAIPLRYLDYLIHDPVRTVVLFKGGVPVTVPAPERYAIHKLIVAAVRHSNSPRAKKDIAQAEQILRAMLHHRRFAIEEAWEEASQRGPQWRENLQRGTEMLAPELRARLQETVKKEKPKRQKSAKGKSAKPDKKRAKNATKPLTSRRQE